MQLQMKLSGETLSALEVVCDLMYGDSNANISKGYLIEKLLFICSPEFDEIDWKAINEMKFDEIDYNRPSLQTALVISDQCYELLNEFQKKLSKILGTKKVYKPYVIKLILRFSIITLKENKNTIHETHNDTILVGTINFNDIDGNKPNENSRLKCKEDRLNKLYQLAATFDCLAIQEYIPEGRKWIDWWLSDDIEEKYEVITPLAWDYKKHPNYSIAMLVLSKEAIDCYKPLKLKNDDEFNCRYTYGIIEFKGGNKIRVLNVHMIPHSDENRDRISADFWKSVLDEVDAQIGCEEPFYIMGDFNAFDGSDSINRGNLLELQRKMVDVTYKLKGEDVVTYKSGSLERQLDYIFINRKIAFEKIVSPEIDDRTIENGISDHAMVLCETAASVTYEKY